MENSLKEKHEIDLHFPTIFTDFLVLFQPQFFISPYSLSTETDSISKSSVKIPFYILTHVTPTTLVTSMNF